MNKMSVIKSIIDIPTSSQGGALGGIAPQLYFDGCSKGNPGKAGAGAVIYKNDIISLENELYSHSKFVGARETNNTAEYTGLIIGLKDAINLNIKNLIVKGDSMLVIKQMQGIYQVKSPSLLKLFQEAKTLERHFETVSYQHIYRKDNKKADHLANIGAEDGSL
jgi:ribonuclease HI